jgi:outer membrane protein assembly factor BamA
MLRTLCCSFRSISKVLTVFVFLGVIGVVNVWAQEPASSRPVLDFEGNKIFSKQELLGLANKCLDKLTAAYETDQLDYCLHVVRTHMTSKGYLQARLEKTLYEQTDGVQKAVIPVVEGPLYRVGKLDINGAKVLAAAQILDMINLNPGDIADGKKLGDAMYERVKEAYGNLGYIQYTAEIVPTFQVKEKAEEGVVDFAINVDEGAQFKIRSIKFAGGDKRTIDMLRRELMVRDGEVYSFDLLQKSITRMNNTGLFDQIDSDRDVDYQTDVKAALLDLTIKLKKKIASSVSP